MNQEDLNIGKQIPENTQKITLGERLKTTREMQNMTISDISDQLRVPIHVIENIEVNEYQEENLSVFILGYIRNYARLLKIPVHEINQLLIDLGWKPIEEKTIKTTVDTRQISTKDKRVRLVTYAIIITLIILVVVWHYAHQSIDSTINDQNEEIQKPSVAQTDNTNKKTQRIDWPNTPAYFLNEDI